MDSGLARQAHSDFDLLYTEAEHAQNFLRDRVMRLCADEGFSFELASLKSKERAKDKCNSEWGGDASLLCDLARCSIICETFEDARRAMDALQKNFTVAGMIKDNFTNPKPNGYRDANYKIRCDNNHVAEVQVHVREMLRAKKNEDPLYNIIRAMDANAQSRPLTPKESAVRKRLVEAGRALYDAAAERSGFMLDPTVKPEDAIHRAETRADAAITAVEAYRSHPKIRLLSDKAEKAANLMGAHTRDVLHEIRPDGTFSNAYKAFLTVLRDDPAALKSYVTMHNALEDSTKAWANAIAVTRHAGSNEDTLSNIDEKISAQSAVLSRIGDKLLGQQGRSVSEVANTLGRSIDRQATAMIKSRAYRLPVPTKNVFAMPPLRWTQSGVSVMPKKNSGTQFGQ